MPRLFLSLLLTFLFLSCGSNKNVLEVTYLANEGFMVTMGSTKVLIDAFPQSSYYADPSDSLVSKLMNDVPPYHQVDYLLVTHDHSDHFNAELASGFLRRHPAAEFVANSAVCKKMAGDSSVGLKMTPVELERGERKTIRGGKADITILRLDHGGYREVSNLAYLVRSSGFTFLHVGDARLSDNKDFLRKIDWASFNVDLLFIVFFDRDSEVQSIIQEMIKPRYVILMHIPPGEELERANAREKVHSRTIVFTNEGQTKQFDASEDMSTHG